jgi:hypothetical protein
MLLAVLHRLLARGVSRVVGGASSSSVGQLAHYQKAGFRLARIERDCFTPERGYPEERSDRPGIQCGVGSFPGLR